MITKLEFFIALRYLRTKNKEGFISVVSAFSLIGMALGVATLIIVMSVMSGYEVQLIDKILGINGHVTLTHSAGSLKDFDNITKQLSTIKEVAYAAPIINGQAMICSSAGRSKGVLVRGIDGSLLEKKRGLDHEFTKQEDFLLYKQNAGILIGKNLAQDIGVAIGDYVKLISPKVENLAFGMMPRIKTFRVIGVFDVGMHEYNSNFIFMPLQSAQIFFEHKDAVTDIEIEISDTRKTNLAKHNLKKVLARNIIINDWTTANQSLAAALRVERNVMFLILMLIVIIAAFNIISSLIMLVQEKQKSIAILKTIGMRRSSVIKIFVICGALIGIIGTCLGVLIGVLFTLNIEAIRQFLESLTGQTIFDPVIYFLTSLPAELSIANTLLITSSSLILSLLATIYPAWKAASIMPAVALRYE